MSAEIGFCALVLGALLAIGLYDLATFPDEPTPARLVTTTAAPEVHR